ncbi:MAG: hypothetical protein WDO15_15545 [Bacteroidota bacterium]
MRKGFVPMEGVDSWQLSNFPVFSGAAHLAALEVFDKAGMKRLRKKSILLTWLCGVLIERTKQRPVYNHNA